MAFMLTKDFGLTTEVETEMGGFPAIDAMLTAMAATLTAQPTGMAWNWPAMPAAWISPSAWGRGVM